jgi:hypothetical protein
MGAKWLPETSPHKKNFPRAAGVSRRAPGSPSYRNGKPEKISPAIVCMSRPVAGGVGGIGSMLPSDSPRPSAAVLDDLLGASSHSLPSPQQATIPACTKCR